MGGLWKRWEGLRRSFQSVGKDEVWKASVGPRRAFYRDVRVSEGTERASDRAAIISEGAGRASEGIIETADKYLQNSA